MRRKLARRRLLAATFVLIATCTTAWSQTNGVVTNQTYYFNPDAIGSGPHSLKIATLIENNGGDLDHLRLMVITTNWLASTNSAIDVLFGNRGGFTYIYTNQGAQGNADARLVAYQNADTSVDVYLMFTNNYVAASYTVLENLQDTVYTSPVDIFGTTPPGTLVFDSSSSSYPPATSLTFSGNMGVGISAPGAKLEVNGNIKLTSGTGASITFADGTI